MVVELLKALLLQGIQGALGKDVLLILKDSLGKAPDGPFLQSERLQIVLVAGNDVEEDLSIRSLGVKTYLVTDTMENKKNLPVESEYVGTLAELLDFVKLL